VVDCTRPFTRRRWAHRKRDILLKGAHGKPGWISTTATYPYVTSSKPVIGWVDLGHGAGARSPTLIRRVISQSVAYARTHQLVWGGHRVHSNLEGTLKRFTFCGPGTEFRHPPPGVASLRLV